MCEFVFVFVLCVCVYLYVCVRICVCVYLCVCVCLLKRYILHRIIFAEHLPLQSYAQVFM